MEQIKRSFTREELHELVWLTPIQTLAARFNISDRGLSKICERHLVPVPGRGYWAKVEAGQVLKKTPLRAVANTDLHTVYIGSKPHTPQSDYFATVLAKAKRELEEEDDTLLNERVPSTPRAASNSPPTAVASTAKKDAAVKVFIAELRKVRPDRDDFIKLKYVRINPADTDRVENLLHALATTLAPYGFTFDFPSRSIGFSKGGSRIRFEIAATRKRVTEVSSSGWKSFSYVHIGRLAVQIYGQADGTKKIWTDTEGFKIEKALEQMVESFRLNYVAEREEDEKRRTDEARKAHLASRRKLVELRAKREDDRLTFLRRIADARREVDDLRATISVVPQSGELPPEYERMIAWARTRVAALEAETAVEKIQATLVEQELYPDPDELFDPEGNPPPKANYWDD